VDADLALQEAEAKFEAKRREVRGLRELIEQIQKDLARRESAPPPEPSASHAQTGEDEQMIRDLRSKVKRLESDLKERHNERNELERRLEKMQARADTLAEHEPAGRSRSPEADTEDELMLPEEAESQHPLRLIEFPRNFQERLKEFPRHVARGALVILGRLAAGEAAAFGGAKRLKSAPTVVRQRVGIDFRLLFRLLPDRIQVIDLIPRQDLERKIKTIK
jgi:hypothetical protein